MYVMLTDAGRAALDANRGPVVVTEFKLGDGVNYVPNPSQTDLRGNKLFSGTPSAADPVTPNVWRYLGVMDSSVPEFQWGELGLYLGDGTLFAIAVSSLLIKKTAGSPTVISVFVSMVGQNYDLWLDIGDNGNPFRIPALVTVDQLPASNDAWPNAYIVSGFQDDQQAFMAYTNKQGWWNFDAYDYLSASSTETEVIAVGQSSVTIRNSDYKSFMTPSVPGSVIVQLVSGPAYSYTRYIKEVIVGASTTTFNFYSPWAIQPNVGDFIVFFVMRSVEVRVPTATQTQLGVVKVGAGLNIDIQGSLSVDYTQIPYPVKTFNGKTGDVTYEVKDQNSTTGTSLITDSGLTSGTGQLRTLVGGQDIQLDLDANGNLRINNTYSYTPTHTPATTTTLGEVIVGQYLSVNAQGVLTLAQTPTTVNGQSGNVTIGVQDQTPGTGNSLVTYSGEAPAPGGQSVGIAKLRTIVAGTNTAVTRDVNDNLVIANTYALPVAGAWGAPGAVLGGVYVDGTTITVDSNGMIKAHVSPSDLPVATTTTLGAVIVGPTLEVTAQGVLDYNLQQASTTVLGGVRVDGTSITINAATGVISSRDAITSVNGITSGDVVIKAVDNNTATGISWITDSGATTGLIKLKTVVAGTGIAVTGDANNNLVVGLDKNGTITGVTNANLMWNENGEFGNTDALYKWTDSLGKAITAQSTTSDGLFLRVAAQSTAATGTITSPMYKGGNRLMHAAAMNMRADATSTGNITFQVVYYKADGTTIATTGSQSPQLVLDANWHRLFNTPETPDASFTQFQVVINYANATWSSLDFQRGKVEAGSAQTLYSEEGTVYQSVQLTRNTAYTLPTASASTLGGVKIGSGIAVAGDGTISVTLPIASASTLGVVKVGSGLNVAGDGTLSSANYYDVQAGVLGTMTSSQLIGQHVATRTVTFAANFSGSQAYAGAVATSSSTLTVVLIHGGTSTQVGTFTFASGARTATFSTTGGAAVQIVAGDVLQFFASATADSTLGSVSVTLLGAAV